jgi:hypothetical protein
MWSKVLTVTVFSYIFFVVVSCKKDNTSGVPSYVKIDSMVVTTDYLTQGSSSSNISDAWIFANDQELGAYELPNEIPVLESGNVNLKIFGGIKVSGVSRKRESYPFYEMYETDTPLVEKETIHIVPKLRYKTNVKFPWKEDFDDLTTTFDTTAASKVSYIRITNPDSVREGKGSMYAYMEGENNYFQAVSTKRVSLPKNGDPVYFEFDYITDRAIQINLRSYLTDGRSVLFNVVRVGAKTNDNGELVWNKLYAFLSPYVSQRVDSYEYRIEIESGLAASEKTGFLMMDNMKLVY